MKTPPVFLANNLCHTPIKHGFFGRCGGVPTGLYASLNTGCGSSDDPAHIEENRTRIARAMRVENDHLIGVYQVHSAKVVAVNAPWPETPPQADALVSATPGLALGILTADCAPVLFADHKARIIGAAHAGWRGALDGVLEATIAAMIDLGANLQNIQATIGPCIAQTSYEVGPDFLQSFTDAKPGYQQFFMRGAGDRWHFDLESFCAYRLTKAGVPGVEKLGLDTCAQEDDFFSYRRATKRGESDYGRNISVILLQSNALGD
ncbi:MAG: polyphenol oxidase [Robiginitomaculum sp.]|nr:MAG: polyphenol oxidase [Robiginitomaculum sp.]